MYGGNYGSYSSPPPELSNNPFIEHTTNPLTRYPEISGFTSPTNPQFGSWTGQPNGIPQQQGYNTYNPQPPQQQQYTPGWGGSPNYQTQGSGLSYPQQTSSGTQFQPSSSFGQQLSSAMDAGGFTRGGPVYQQQPQPQLSPGYGIPNGYNITGGVPSQIQIPTAPYQQTGVTNTPGYLSEFDPYANIGQGGWDGQQQQQQQRQQQQQQQQGGGLANGGALNSQNDTHPREFIRKYKTELEAWDTYSWKQLMNSLEVLKEAWERRKQELEASMKQLSTNWAAQQELAQYQSALREADLSFSSVAASYYQLKEVLDGYRQSTDVASRRRVKEAMNAALRSLPEYPPN